MNNKYIIYIILGFIIATIEFHGNEGFIFNIDQQDYIENVENLTTITILEEFLELENAIYVDNIYKVYQKFFYKLMGDLPKGLRSEHVKVLIEEMDKFLIAEDVTMKLQIFDNFIEKFEPLFESIFEYDAEETRLEAAQFNELFVTNGIDEVLKYSDHTQMHAFMVNISNGIRVYLLYNRPQINTEKMLIFKAIIDKFLEADGFAEKRKNLKEFVAISKKLLI